MATLLAVAGALSSVELGPSSAGSVLAACRRFLPADLGFTALLVLAVLVAGLVVLSLLVRSLVRQLRGSRRYLTRLGPVAPTTTAGIPVVVFAAERADAFCAGYARPRIYLSSGALDALDGPELEAVLAHESHHRDRRDPLRLLVIRSLADALFFMPALRRVGSRYAALAELAADEAALGGRGACARGAGGRGAGALASALLAFARTRDADAVVGISPERADHLLGEAPPRWELPLSVFAGVLLTVAGVGALGPVAADLVSGSTLELPMLLAESCMVLLLLAPLAGAVLLLRRTKPWARVRRLARLGG